MQSLLKYISKEKGPFLTRKFSMKNVAAGSSTSCHQQHHVSPHPPLPAFSQLFLENLCKSFLTGSGRHPDSGSSVHLGAVNQASQSLQSSGAAPKGIQRHVVISQPLEVVWGYFPRPDHTRPGWRLSPA